jgi:hypothetical protein
MSVATIPAVPDERLEDAEYEAALERLRAYVVQLDEAKEHTTKAGQRRDAGSLHRAADLRVVYEDGRWVDQMPAPKKQRGRREKPDSPERFYKWAEQHVSNPATGSNLKPTTSRKMLDAEEVRRIIRTPLREIPESLGLTTFGPLIGLLKQKRSQDVPEVWRRALELADGQHPGPSTIRKAIADHNQATGFTGQKANRQKGKVKYGQKVVSDFRQLLSHSTPAEVREVMAELKQEWDQWVAEVRS